MRGRDVRKRWRAIQAPGAGQVVRHHQAVNRHQLIPAQRDARLGRGQQRIDAVDVGVHCLADRLGVPAQPGHDRPGPADANARHRAPPGSAAAVAVRDELAHRAHLDLGQALRDQRPEPARNGVGRRRCGLSPAAGRQLDHLQRHGAQARLAVLANRRLQVLDQDGRALAQRDRHQVVTHGAQQALDVQDLVLLRIEVEPRDRRDRQAFHARA